MEDKGLIILVDGSNVAFFHPTFKQFARYENLHLIIKYLTDIKKKFPINFQILVDASLRHKIDNKKALEVLIKKVKIIQCPSKREADFFFLTFFQRHKGNVLIISNDDFRDCNLSEIRQSKFALIMQEVILTPAIEEYFKK